MKIKKFEIPYASKSDLKIIRTALEHYIVCTLKERGTFGPNQQHSRLLKEVEEILVELEK